MASNGVAVAASPNAPDATTQESCSPDAKTPAATAAYLKVTGNEKLRAGSLDEALQFYDQAVACKDLNDEDRAAVQCNRALALLRLQRYDDCIAACGAHCALI
eukprot:6172560-Pleurochrysis_carterae.AAC.5